MDALLQSMGGMPLCGGAGALAWSRMPWQSWPEAALGFVAAWVAMMGLMMLPSMAPVLWRHGRGVKERTRGVASAFALAGGYLAAWALLGGMLFVAGATTAAWWALAAGPAPRAMAWAGGAVAMAAGALQFSRWKARHLACCRAYGSHDTAAMWDILTAWRQGMRWGVHCCCSCAGLTAVLLANGVMNAHAMAAVAAAVTAERLAPPRIRMHAVVGGLALGVGAWQIVGA